MVVMVANEWKITSTHPSTFCETSSYRCGI
jgi:hypothetical protein